MFGSHWLGVCLCFVSISCFVDWSFMLSAISTYMSILIVSLSMNAGVLEREEIWFMFGKIGWVKEERMARKMKNYSLCDLYVNSVFYLSSLITYSMRETQTALNVHINLSVCVCVREIWATGTFLLAPCDKIAWKLKHESMSVETCWQTNRHKYKVSFEKCEGQKTDGQDGEMDLLTKTIVYRIYKNPIKKALKKYLDTEVTLKCIHLIR